MPAVVAQTLGGLSAEGLRQFFARESARFTAQRMETRAALRADADAWMGGVPMHWMRDWPLPYPLVITKAEDTTLTDLDGFQIDDFALGDGAAPFGHTPEPVVKAIRKQAERGISFMLPTRKALEAGAALNEFYGDYRWQIALSATDANRNAIKVARAVTRREKVLVFNGGYHGAVDDLMVRADRGRTKQRRGLVGQVHDLRRGAIAVEFNDLAAVEAALAAGDVAAILTEPVMTGAGLVLPTDGFLAGLRDLASRHGTILIFDESQTHTAARGGFARTAGVTPDILVIGKGVAGGMPTAIWGLCEEIAGRFAAYDALRAEGHTGMGTSLAGNAMQAAALLATVTEVATPKAFAKIERNAARLAEGLESLFARFSLPWQVARVGGRVAFTCAAQPVTNGTEAAAAAMPAIERAIHIGLLNRGCLISPYHNAMLVTPVTSKVQIARLLTAFEDVLFALAGSGRAEPQAEVAPRPEPAPAAAEVAAPVAEEAAVQSDARDTAQQPEAPAAPRRGWWRKDNAGAAVKAVAAPVAPKPVEAAVQAPVVATQAEVKDDVTSAPRRKGWWQGAAKAKAAPPEADAPKAEQKPASDEAAKPVAKPAVKETKAGKAAAAKSAEAKSASKESEKAKASDTAKPAGKAKAAGKAVPVKGAEKAKVAVKADNAATQAVEQKTTKAETVDAAKPARRGWWQRG